MSDEVKAAAERWDAAFNSGDTGTLGSYYTAKGRVVPAGGAPVAGPDAIGKFFADLISNGFSGHKITVDNVDTTGAVAIATGKWQLSGPGENGATAQYGGNWVNVLEKTPEGWRVLLHSWN